jgi:hypothetical protein
MPQAAPQPANAPPEATSGLTAPINIAMTCAELVALLHAHDKAAGNAILYLDAYYAGRSGFSDSPAGWRRTVAQGIGGTCSISVNTSRTVLDVIAQLYREYRGMTR